MGGATVFAGVCLSTKGKGYPRPVQGAPPSSPPGQDRVPYPTLHSPPSTRPLPPLPSHIQDRVPLPLPPSLYPIYPTPPFTSHGQEKGSPPSPPPKPGRQYPSSHQTRARTVVWRGRCASCVHAGGLSCYRILICNTSIAVLEWIAWNSCQ